MKRKRFIGIGLLLIILLLAICLKNPISNLFEEDDKRYALNLYGEDFHYIRGLEAFYDRNGELKSIEVYLIYDSSTLDIANESIDGAADYPEAKSEFIVNDDGSVKISNFLTSKSIEAGALSDNAFYMVSSMYDRIKTEDDIKLLFEDQMELAREKNIPADETNYIIMNGKNVDW